MAARFMGPTATPAAAAVAEKRFSGGLAPAKPQNGRTPGQEPDRIEHELKTFWASAWGPHMKPPPDGMHPKGLCAKLMNDVLRCNPNKYRYQNRDATNLVLDHIERAFQEAGVIKAGIVGPDQRLHVTRVMEADLVQCEKFRSQLEEKGSLRSWAQSVLPRNMDALTAENMGGAAGNLMSSAAMSAGGKR